MRDKIQIIGVPTDLGQTHRGVDVGPSAIRYAGLVPRLTQLGYDVKDTGNIHVPARGSLRHEELLPAIRKACEAAYLAAKKAVSDGWLPIFLGGDHSIAIGTIGGMADVSPLGVLWVDAHGDFNTPETSKSGNIHGMALATLTGKGYPELVNIGKRGGKLDPENVILIGVRDLDPEEKKLLKESGITVYTMRDIDERGISVCTHEALGHLRHMERIHVSLDVDCLDPMVAPGVGTPVPGGLTYREAHLLMEIIADIHAPVSMDIVEINPVMDIQNQSSEAAVDLCVSLFGKTIL